MLNATFQIMMDDHYSPD